MDSLWPFVLGVVVAGIVNIITALFSRKHGLQLLPWLLLYMCVHGTTVLCGSDAAHGVAMEWSKRFPSVLSYAVVFLIFGGVGIVVWSGIRSATESLERATAHEAVPGNATAIQRSSVSSSRHQDHTTVNQPAKANSVTKKEQLAQPAIIQTAPTFGNLADRASSLADEIMSDMYMHGWRQAGNPGDYAIQQMPTKPEERQQWITSRSNYFHFRFFQRVLEIRNEFAQLHLRDERLDDFFKYEGMIEQANKQMAAANISPPPAMPLLPTQIEEVAERLRILAKQIPVSRAAPRELPFSVAPLRAEKPEFPFEIVVTITPTSEIVGGFIAVEFEGPKAMIASDLQGSTLIFRSEDAIGNKPLQQYLSARTLGESYVTQIGKTPVTPNKPMHVTASGPSAFKVERVLFFEP